MLRPSTFLIDFTIGHNVKYLGVIFDKRITQRLHIEMTEAKAFKHLLESTSYSKVSV
jgi:hypothetical protein